MEKIKAVIFDFGGVLIDWNPYYLYRKVMTNDTEIERFLQEIHFNEWNYSFDQGYPIALGVKEMCRLYPQRADLIRIYDERWMETLGTTFDANIDLVKKVKAAGTPIYGLTNWSNEKFELVRAMFPFFNLFADIAVSGLEKIAKPDPRIYQNLLNRNHLQANDCLYIDDSEVNIRGGRALGLQTVLYQSSQQLRQELAAHGAF